MTKEWALLTIFGVDISRYSHRVFVDSFIHSKCFFRLIPFPFIHASFRYDWLGLLRDVSRGASQKCVIESFRDMIVIIATNQASTLFEG
jgi:hypothetical protein